MLYLVSRSFEDSHKMPLLGREKAFDSACATPSSSDDMWAPDRIADVREWIKFRDGLGVDATNRVAHVLARPNVCTGGSSIRASHGCFDNAIDIVGDALGYWVSPKNPTRVKIHRLDY